MKSNPLSLKLKEFCCRLEKEGLTLEESKSLIIKIFLLVKHRIIKEAETDKETVNLGEYLESKVIPYSKLSYLLEKHQVLDREYNLRLIEEIVPSLNGISNRELYECLFELSFQKRRGQYFTHKEIVETIYQNLSLDEIKNGDKVNSIVDLTIGIGDFLEPLLKEENLLFYGVELEPLTFEFLLFNIIWNPNNSEKRKARLVLTLKQGDSLLGYQKNSTSKISTLLIEYRKKRIEALYSKQITEDLIFEILSMRRSLSKKDSIHSRFSWFIDFPEIFLDENGEFLEESGFDIVVGNPPWLSFKEFAKTRYKDIFTQLPFSNQLLGKYNFSLPFLVLAYHLAGKKIGIVIPQGILSESYAINWRKKIVQDKSLNQLILCGNNWFDKVSNEFCILLLDKNKETKIFEIIDQKNQITTNVLSESIHAPQYLIPLITAEIYREIKHIFRESNSLDDYCTIRRGLTLSKKYQNFYSTCSESEKRKYEMKKLIRHNKSREKTSTGVFNFQIYYNGEEFVYDRGLLGAPGSPGLFEQPKIIRRNRGRRWLIGLDSKGDKYVNDIFDIIIPNINKISLEALFAYLSSSLVQFIIESCLQRDITSNQVRQLPFLNFTAEEKKKLGLITSEWIKSSKKEKDFVQLREKVDKIIFEKIKVSTKLVQYIKKNTTFHWV